MHTGSKGSRTCGCAHVYSGSRYDFRYCLRIVYVRSINIIVAFPFNVPPTIDIYELWKVDNARRCFDSLFVRVQHFLLF